MRLPTPKTLKEEIPLSPSGAANMTQFRDAAKKIFHGKDARKAIIVGPCSIHDIDSALDYAKRLKNLSSTVESTCMLIMRVYLEKPRTHLGWKGLVYDPYLDGSDDMAVGLALARQLLTQLAEMGIPTATEFLDPLIAPYLEDLITWGFIGARTGASPIHRQLASRMPFPVGFKNALDGTLDHMIYGISSAREPHTFFAVDEDATLVRMKSDGNPQTHAVLRGSDESPNYNQTSIKRVLKKLHSNDLEQRLMVDCAHGNSAKDVQRQKHVFHSLLETMDESLMGIMLESFIEEGTQSSPHVYGQSITDPCLSWECTEELLYKLHNELEMQPVISSV